MCEKTEYSQIKGENQLKSFEWSNGFYDQQVWEIWMKTTGEE